MKWREGRGNRHHNASPLVSACVFSLWPSVRYSAMPNWLTALVACCYFLLLGSNFWGVVQLLVYKETLVGEKCENILEMGVCPDNSLAAPHAKCTDVWDRRYASLPKSDHGLHSLVSWPSELETVRPLSELINVHIRMRTSPAKRNSFAQGIVERMRCMLGTDIILRHSKLAYKALFGICKPTPSWEKITFSCCGSST